MIGKKVYLQPRDMVLNAIHDLADMQKAGTLMSDSTNGIIHLIVEVYKIKREYRFSIEDDVGRSEVFIELAGDEPDTRRLIDHEFALLDYVLIDRAKKDLADNEAWDRLIEAERTAFPEADPDRQNKLNMENHNANPKGG